MAISFGHLPKQLKLLTQIANIKRSIMSTSRNMDKVMDKLEQNPYYEKYAERIAALQKTSPEEFMQRVDQRFKHNEQEKKKKFASVDTRQFSSVLNPKESLNEHLSSQEKKLIDIFKIELVKDKDASEIENIWKEYHLNKEVISATIDLHLYTDIQKIMKQFPTFLFPLPRSQGYEFMMCQSSGDAVHFTPLLAYQVHQENAPECLTMVHYTELCDKGIVLMRGEYDKNVLNGQEAQCLANQFQMYYNNKNKRNLQLLEMFTKSPDTFKHMDLISQLENIGLE